MQHKIEGHFILDISYFMTQLVVESQFVNRISHEYKKQPRKTINKSQQILADYKTESLYLCFGTFKLEFKVNLYNKVLLNYKMNF